jgi:hypothetical protein
LCGGYFEHFVNYKRFKTLKGNSDLLLFFVRIKMSYII